MNKIKLVVTGIAAAAVLVSTAAANWAVKFWGPNDKGFPVGWPDRVMDVGASTNVPAGYHTNMTPRQLEEYQRDMRPLYEFTRSNYLYQAQMSQQASNRALVRKWASDIDDARMNYDLMNTKQREDATVSMFNIVNQMSKLLRSQLESGD